MREHGIGGVHGPLIELFTCKDTFTTAVEVTGGNSLFHVVVDNDDVATRIIKHLNAEKGGRVSFLPLNRLRSDDPAYPASSDVVPLISRLKFAPALKPAFLQVGVWTMMQGVSFFVGGGGGGPSVRCPLPSPPFLQVCFPRRIVCRSACAWI